MNRFKNILCVVNLNKSWKSAINQAISLAETNQAQLTVLSVIPLEKAIIAKRVEGGDQTTIQSNLINEQLGKLNEVLEPLRKNKTIKSKILLGIPFIEIVREVLRNHYDLVIKTIESPDWLDQYFGSEDMHLLRKCPSPVWLLNPKAPSPFKRIVAAVDVEDNYPDDEVETRLSLNQQIIETAGSLALSESSELHIASAWHALVEDLMSFSVSSSSEEEIKEHVNQYRKSVKGKLGVLIDRSITKLGQDAYNYISPKIHLIEGSARKEIPAFVKNINCDLIVMGTVGRSGISGFIMGNTAETILNQIECSVLAIKPPGFTTPVTLD